MKSAAVRIKILWELVTCMCVWARGIALFCQTVFYLLIYRWYCWNNFHITILLLVFSLLEICLLCIQFHAIPTFIRSKHTMKIWHPYPHLQKSNTCYLLSSQTYRNKKRFFKNTNPSSQPLPSSHSLHLSPTPPPLTSQRG